MTTTTDWVALMADLGADFARRTAGHDEDDSFVAESYAALRARGVAAAGVPTELGGGGASHAELAAMIRELARHCSSTALAFSMDTHPSQRKPTCGERATRGPRLCSGASPPTTSSS